MVQAARLWGGKSADLSLPAFCCGFSRRTIYAAFDMIPSACRALPLEELRPRRREARVGEAWFDWGSARFRSGSSR